MKPYSEYTAEELATERLFIRWIRHPEDSPIRIFWEQWLQKHPHMSGTVSSARELVRSVSDWELEEMSGEETGSLWNRIRTSIELLPEIERLDPSLKALATNWNFLRWSAGILVVIGLFLGVVFWESGASGNSFSQTIMCENDTLQVTVNQDSTSKEIERKNRSSLK
ncbi:hypothetical protein [Arundinibacter roseus]|uniref:Uncharacterized protein n=1 Tax=Arundinibacter roseus TaxID=2070510 RepID=A0A4V2X9W4_9BACT|nr:hypothetical protein [Arundinibacter roseus]TDB65325.1 hypothetical protein EZE20_11550 [Arundinibacter roseus]